MNLQVGNPVVLKNKTTGTTVNCTVENIQGQEVTFKSATGDVFTISARTLANTYDITTQGGGTAVTATEGPRNDSDDMPVRRERGPERPDRPQQLSVPGDIENYKNQRVRDIIRNINHSENRSQNEARIRQDLVNLANELRGQGYPQDLAEQVANTAFVVPLNPPSLTLGSIFRNSFNPDTEMSGSKYMHSFLTKDYLLNDFANIEEVKNFINVIAMNKSGVLLKEFKENKQSLKNIILGLIRIAYSIDVLNIEYEYEYNIVYKDQVLNNVVFDFDQWTMNKIIAVIKTQGEGAGARDILIQLTEQELKRSNIVKLGAVRSTDEMGVDEVPAPIRLEFGAGLNYQEDGLNFGKDYLKVIVADDELADKLIKFINGALLLYPEMIEDIPENITLVEGDFSVFEYRKMIIANENGGDVIEVEEVLEVPEVQETPLVEMSEEEIDELNRLGNEEVEMDAINDAHDIQEEMEAVQIADATEEIEVENEVDLEKTAQ